MRRFRTPGWRLINGLLPASLLIRSRPGVAPGGLSAVAEKHLEMRDTQLAPAKIRTMDRVMLDSTARQNFNLLLLGTFAGIALLLAALGIYSVMSYTVEQRTHEIGILKLVLGDGLKLAAAGVPALRAIRVDPAIALRHE